jgi:ligand-binding SRPBCC domain-containing protein
MPLFESSTTISRPLAEVFEFLCHPANLIELTPPDYNMRLVEGPEKAGLGAQIVLQTRRWGFSQRIVQKITAFELNRLITDEQVEGPFKKWAHSHILEEVPGGTRMTDRVEFESPGGLLGFVFTEDAVENELQELFEFRTQKLNEIFSR